MTNTPFIFELLLPDEPILICTISSSFSLKDNFEPYLNELAAILDNLNQQVFYVVEVNANKKYSFQDFLVGINTATRNERAIIRHPNTIETIVATTDSLIKMGAKGINSEIFGNLSIPVFDTLEEALAYSREQIRQQ